MTPSQRALLIATSIEFSADRSSVTLVPAYRLEAGTEISVMVSPRILSEDGAPISLEGEFDPDRVVAKFQVEGGSSDTAFHAALVEPTPHAMGQALELESVRLSFSAPVDRPTLQAGSIVLEDAESGEVIVPAEVRWAGDDAVLMLPASANPECDRLCPQRRYGVAARGEVRAASGAVLTPIDPAEQSFTTAPCRDRIAPVIEGAALVAVEDVAVEIGWTTNEPAASRVELVSCQGVCPNIRIEPRDEACAVDRCRVPPPFDLADDDATSTDSTTSSDRATSTESDGGGAQSEVERPVCRHSVRVSGLRPSTRYVFRAVAEDASRNVTPSEEIETVTSDPRPHLVLTEILAAPLRLIGRDGKPDADIGKFVEIRNVGEIAVSLRPEGSGASRVGWSLGRCRDEACSGLCEKCRPWLMRPLEDHAVLAPGAYAVAAGRDFDPVLMEVHPGAMLLGGDGGGVTMLSNGLTAGAAAAYALLDPSGRIVSRYGGTLGVPADHQGRSMERWPPTGESSEWRWSESAVAGLHGMYASPGWGGSRAGRGEAADW